MGRVTALLDGTDSGWVQKSMLVTAWQSAGPALDVSRCPSRLGLSSWLIRLQEVHVQTENAIVADIVEHTTYGNRTDDK